jgi:hypothetical protein
MDVRQAIENGQMTCWKVRRVNTTCPQCGGGIADRVSAWTLDQPNNEPRRTFTGKQCRNCTELYDIKELIK